MIDDGWWMVMVDGWFTIFFTEVTEPCCVSVAPLWPVTDCPASSHSPAHHVPGEQEQPGDGDVPGVGPGAPGPRGRELRGAAAAAGLQRRPRGSQAAGLRPRQAGRGVRGQSDTEAINPGSIRTEIWLRFMLIWQPDSDWQSRLPLTQMKTWIYVAYKAL